MPTTDDAKRAAKLTAALTEALAGTGELRDYHKIVDNGICEVELAELRGLLERLRNGTPPIAERRG